MIAQLIKFLLFNPELLKAGVDVLNVAKKSRDPLSVMRRVQAQALSLTLEHGYPAPEPRGQQ